MAWARTVAVVVPSAAVSEVFDATSRTICAPAFSSSYFSSISLATVTPSLVIVGEPNFFSMTTLRPFGPRVTLTASASLLTPRRIAWRASSLYVILFAILLLLLVCCRHPERSEGSQQRKSFVSRDPSPSTRLRMTRCVTRRWRALHPHEGWCTPHPRF